MRGTTLIPTAHASLSALASLRSLRPPLIHITLSFSPLHDGGITNTLTHDNNRNLS